MRVADCGAQGGDGPRRVCGRAVAGLTALLAVLAVMPHPARARETTLPPDDPEVTRWEAEVVDLEALDRDQPDPPDAILFIGSSSIRLWKSIAADMDPWPVIRRGYGGARYRDLCHYAGRLVASHEPRGIVVFVANDITSPTASPAVERVMKDVRATHEAIRDHHPDVPVWYIAVTPTESRWPAWPEIERLNAALAELADREPATFFVATAERFLDPATGRPKPSLFRDDRLHLSPAGYRIWSDLIGAALEARLGEPASAAEPVAAAAN